MVQVLLLTSFTTPQHHLSVACLHHCPYQNLTDTHIHIHIRIHIHIHMTHFSYMKKRHATKLTIKSQIDPAYRPSQMTMMTTAWPWSSCCSGSSSAFADNCHAMLSSLSNVAALHVHSDINLDHCVTSTKGTNNADAVIAVVVTHCPIEYLLIQHLARLR